MFNVNANIPVVLGIAVFATIAFASYAYLRNAKGTIELTLDQTAFLTGDTITGHFILTTKKPIEGERLVVSLVGTEKETTRDHRSTSRTKENEVFREDVLLEAKRDFPAGAMVEHTFNIPVPAAESAIIPNNKLGKALKFAADVLGDRNVTWKVEVRLYAKGIDLSESKKITIE